MSRGGKKDGLLYVKQGGRFLEGSALQSVFEQVAGPHIRRGVFVLQEGAMDETPVLTGNLRRGWFVTELEWEGTKLLAKLGNKVVYLNRVNKTSKKNAGFVERSITARRDNAMDTLRGGMSEMKDHIWEKG